MPTPEIIERVRELDAELAETQTSPAIESLRLQVKTVILEPEHVPHYKSLGEKLRLQFDGFKVDHPKLAAVMERVTAELTAAGL